MQEIQEHILRLRVWAVSRDGEILSAHSTYYRAEAAWGGDTTLPIIYLPEQ